MEPASFAVGIFALVGVFENAMTFFTYVKIAKSFGDELQTYTVRLEIVHLRLSRWGKSVGLTAKVDDVRNLESSTLDPQTVAPAERVLGEIVKLLQTASKTADDLGEASDQDLGHHKTLVERMRSMSISRQRDASIREKAKWVFHARNELDGLIKNLEELMNGLDGLFLAQASGTTTSNCEEDAKQLLDQGHLHPSVLFELEEVAAKSDAKLAAAIAQHRAPAVGATTFNNNYGSAINNGANISGGQTNHVTF